MPIGRKKNQALSEVPPQITRFESLLPTGDKLITESSGGTDRSYTQLSPATQELVNTSQEGLNNLSQNLILPDSQRLSQIASRSDALYSSLSKAVNTGYDKAFGQVAADNVVRFGGALNSTFGSQLLSEVESQRQQNLAQAKLQADLTAEDLMIQDESSKINRIDALNSLLTGLNNTQLDAVKLGQSTLQSSRDIANQRSLALTRLNNQDNNSLSRIRQALALATNISGLIL